MQNDKDGSSINLKYCCGMWSAVVLTVFPEIFPGPLGCSIIGRAMSNGVWSLNVVDIKSFGIGRWKKVDDKPYGGGPGQILSPIPIGDAVDYANAQFGIKKWICMSPSGLDFSSEYALSLSKKECVGILCGRYEGIDRRVIDFYNMEEVCISNAIVAGGEIPAMFTIEAAVRFLPGVLGNPLSIVCETFSNEMNCEYPQYSKPSVWRGMSVPDVLLSGDHSSVNTWRRIASCSIDMARNWRK